jgi:hypothetical protein
VSLQHRRRESWQLGHKISLVVNAKTAEGEAMFHSQVVLQGADRRGGGGLDWIGLGVAFVHSIPSLCCGRSFRASVNINFGGDSIIIASINPAAVAEQRVNFNRKIRSLEKHPDIGSVHKAIS